MEKNIDKSKIITADERKIMEKEKQLQHLPKSNNVDQIEIVKTKPTEQDKVYKKTNTLIKGIALWYLIPAFAVIAIIGLLLFVWVWDGILRLFS